MKYEGVWIALATSALVILVWFGRRLGQLIRLTAWRELMQLKLAEERVHVSRTDFRRLLRLSKKIGIKDFRDEVDDLLREREPTEEEPKEPEE